MGRSLARGSPQRVRVTLLSYDNVVGWNNSIDATGTTGRTTARRHDAARERRGLLGPTFRMAIETFVTIPYNKNGLVDYYPPAPILSSPPTRPSSATPKTPWLSSGRFPTRTLRPRSTRACAFRSPATRPSPPSSPTPSSRASDDEVLHAHDRRHLLLARAGPGRLRDLGLLGLEVFRHQRRLRGGRSFRCPGERFRPSRLIAHRPSRDGV